jgi:hypothetical protein
MVAALDHSQTLPEFRSVAEAQTALFGERDRRLAALAEFACRTGGFCLTYEPESLKGLEAWYFRLLEGGGFPESTPGQDDFEQYIAAYYGEVLVRSTPFEWFVEECVFRPGRYEIGVRRPLVSVMLTGPKAPEPRDRNKRMQSLWREYRLLTS